jgi:hypothetical protein
MQIAACQLDPEAKSFCDMQFKYGTWNFWMKGHHCSMDGNDNLMAMVMMKVQGCSDWFPSLFSEGALTVFHPCLLQ